VFFFFFFGATLILVSISVFVWPLFEGITLIYDHDVAFRKGEQQR